MDKDTKDLLAVRREVARALAGGGPRHVAGTTYGAGTVVEHGGRVYFALKATGETPGPQAQDWRQADKLTTDMEGKGLRTAEIP